MSKRQSGGGKEALPAHIKRPCMQVARPIHVYPHEPVHGSSLQQSEVDRLENSTPHICSSSSSSSAGSTDGRQQSPDQHLGPYDMERSHTSPQQNSPPRASPLHASSPLRVSPPLISPPQVSPQHVSPSHASPLPTSTTRASPTTRLSPSRVLPAHIYPSHVSPPTHTSPPQVSPTHVSPSRTSPPCSSPSAVTNCEACHYHHHHHHHHHHQQQHQQPQPHHHNHVVNYSAAYSPPLDVANKPLCDSRRHEPLAHKAVPKSSGAVLPIRSHASLPSWIKSEENRPTWAKRPLPAKDLSNAEARSRTGEKQPAQEAEKNKQDLEAANPVTRWPSAPKWVELERVCKAITSGHDRACKLLNHKSPSLDAALGCKKKGTPDFQMTKEEILTRLSVLLGSQYERIVQFAESIPGFGEFSKEDQRILLQIGGLEVILLQLSQIYDHKSKLLRMWEGMWLSPEQARKLTSDFNLAVFFELLFSLAESLHGMHLREEDIAVFSALLLLASDLQGLKQKMQVEALQDKVLSGFAYMLSQNHRCKPNLLPQVLMCMPTLRTISTSYLELTAVPRHTMVVPPPPDSTAMAMRLF